ncbi:hypothetical protein BJ875DRAFT_502502 [Amylocarpus encephaloides]|uniref:Uncharacterized protein n=1 Tax=Amylocarpus encephaloides TaxID=45428 RepID=A0A9P7YR46_9HELO|nr:hypothetical protein BJ875DRAFT_502502 [Amylocarpus encephaloides]
MSLQAPVIASGIGLTTINHFLSHQCQVLDVDINEIDLANIENNENKLFQFHRASLMEDGQFEETKYLLANAAGVMDTSASTDTYTDAQRDRVIDINLTAPTRLIRGSIISVCSKAAISGDTTSVEYTSLKHGLLGVTKNTACRLRNGGIRCNAVLSGVDPFQYLERAKLTNYSAVMSLHTSMQGKSGITRHDIASAILFLASDGTKFISVWGVI